jgi:hypothetical protein
LIRKMFMNQMPMETRLKNFTMMMFRQIWQSMICLNKKYPQVCRVNRKPMLEIF